jgi:16S rRNA (guanine1207-N2)-methyltransferase
VQCTQHGAELNGLTNLTTELNANGSYIGEGSYDLALANPPYYSSFRIAEHFLTAGRDALRVGGKILVVTKRPDWYQQNMTEWYDDVVVTERKSYHLVQGVRPPD